MGLLFGVNAEIAKRDFAELAMGCGARVEAVPEEDVLDHFPESVFKL